MRNAEVVRAKARIETQRRKWLRLGVTPERREQLFLAQHGMCAICECKLVSISAAHLDHDHATNVVRALLCRHCNHLLGHAHEDIAVLRKAINYLNEFKEKK